MLPIERRRELPAQLRRSRSPARGQPAETGVNARDRHRRRVEQSVFGKAVGYPTALASGGARDAARWRALSGSGIGLVFISSTRAVSGSPSFSVHPADGGRTGQAIINETGIGRASVRKWLHMRELPMRNQMAPRRGMPEAFATISCNAGPTGARWPIAQGQDPAAPLCRQLHRLPNCRDKEPRATRATPHRGSLLDGSEASRSVCPAFDAADYGIRNRSQVVGLADDLYSAGVQTGQRVEMLLVRGGEHQPAAV